MDCAPSTPFPLYYFLEYGNVKQKQEPKGEKKNEKLVCSSANLFLFYFRFLFQHSCFNVWQSKPILPSEIPPVSLPDLLLCYSLVSDPSQDDCSLSPTALLSFQGHSEIQGPTKY